MRILTLAALALLTACAGGEDAGGPRALVEGVDVCTYCGMALDDPRRAAQWVPEAGEPLTFDEPGCLVAWLAARPEPAGRAFVADEASGRWIAAPDAYFVRGAVRTGMGFGVVAHAERDAAESLAREHGGRVVAWSRLLQEGVRHAHAH